MEGGQEVSKVLENFHPTADGVSIYYKAWLVAEPKAIIGIVHGLGEHCNRYEHVAQYFNRQGYSVVGYDRRGHGRSGGSKGHTTQFQYLYDEITFLLDWVEMLQPGQAKIFYSHSMGANLAMNYCLDIRLYQIKGIVATGPWIRLPNPPPSLLIAFARLMNRVWPGFAQSNGLDQNAISSDPAEVQKYVSDPLVHSRISARLAVNMFDAAYRLDHYTSLFPIPLLLMHGEADQITDPKGTVAFANRVDGDLEIELWPGMYHEIHNEPGKQMVFERVIQWMDRILPEV